MKSKMIRETQKQTSRAQIIKSKSSMLEKRKQITEQERRSVTLTNLRLKTTMKKSEQRRKNQMRKRILKETKVLEKMKQD